MDTGDTRTFAAFVERVKDALASLQATHVDYLVNNAGISHHNSIALTTEDELDALYRVHVKGVFFLTQRLLPLIRDGGSIVNISSGLTRIIYPGSCAYGAMKGPLRS
ncbi:SDR family NAD(P)-dependent oxidoreductase [Sodalis glossinidius]|uniref:SDR family NAD(P)-dependent oxidoreductase n=1 Tax=Sodalis glossinidius TaxID=63612 RepID=UPI0024358F9F|nr:SDR family NAD(P)-dependent oxidoreductase [Sodalis glossinidius]